MYLLSIKFIQFHYLFFLFFKICRHTPHPVRQLCFRALVIVFGSFHKLINVQSYENGPQTCCYDLSDAGCQLGTTSCRALQCHTTDTLQGVRSNGGQFFSLPEK
ncbi:hypothetical protein CEXT_274611 [Caerostris extrusa]|uniref:Secreted protein n=1 Tax=Caerostris extrusa TaxID=172846 RepID=A0AAV4X911_CAEEX|nr:hypothetical protein CEXT_274611 [Caerostris extrusa]